MQLFKCSLRQIKVCASVQNLAMDRRDFLIEIRIISSFERDNLTLCSIDYLIVDFGYQIQINSILIAFYFTDP